MGRPNWSQQGILGRQRLNSTEPKGQACASRLGNRRQRGSECQNKEQEMKGKPEMKIVPAIHQMEESTTARD